MSSSRKGEQLVLSLDDVRLRRVVDPWDGQSPRVLTAAYKRFSFKTQGGGREVDLRQLILPGIFGKVPVITRSRSAPYGGAPTLRSLPKRRR